ncbi:Acp24A4, partial [Drosophila busckii]
LKNMHLIYLFVVAACSEQFAKNSDEDGVACLAYMPRFSYNAAKNECSKFIYGGCHGNNNKFGTKKQCEAMCVE